MKSKNKSNTKTPKRIRSIEGSNKNVAVGSYFFNPN